MIPSSKKMGSELRHIDKTNFVKLSVPLVITDATRSGPSRRGEVTSRENGDFGAQGASASVSVRGNRILECSGGSLPFKARWLPSP